jgi:signal transduction histidine kinase
MLQRKHQIQNILNAMLSISVKPYSLEEMLGRILGYIVSIPGLTLESKAAIFLVEDKTEVLTIKSCREFSKELKTKCAKVPFGRCLCGRAALLKKIIFANWDDRYHENQCKEISPHAHYCVPILSSSKVLGVLNLYVNNNHSHSKEVKAFLYTIANVLAGIIERKLAELELDEHRQHLKELVKKRTAKLNYTIKYLKQEITERKRAEKALRRSREELRNLSRHLQSVREEERTYVAREIHDELGQLLTALQMDLSYLTQKLSKEKKPLVEITKTMAENIGAGIQSIKRISSNLRPGLMDKLGVFPAIRQHVKEFQAHTKMKCKLNVNTENIVLDKNHSTTIFRIFQETLTNIARHANATIISVNLKKEKNLLILRIKDNGRGITKKEVDSPNSFGIIGMRERAYFIGGDIKIAGLKGKGTIVELIIPLGYMNDKNYYS